MRRGIIWLGILIFMRKGGASFMEERRKIDGGFYLILEGGEGAGKGTQIGEIEKLCFGMGYNVETIREPGGTGFGEKIRSLLLSPEHEELDSLMELFLFSADRRYALENKVGPWLKDGKVVISDRSYVSTLVYQGVAGGIDKKNVEYICGLVTRGFPFDLAVVLDIPVEVGLERGIRVSGGEGSDKIEERDFEYHERVREGYRKFVEENERAVLIDANRTPDEVSDDIFLKVVEGISKKRNGV